MPCDSQPITPEWERQTRAALDRLNDALERQAVTVTIGAEGSIAFVGRTDAERGGLADLCAYRRLMVENSWPLRLAVQRAEALAGRAVNPAAIAAGVHSHDGGRTFGGGH